MATPQPDRPHTPAIYVVSGGVGASGELLVSTVLAQFSEVQVPVTIWPYVHTAEEAEQIVAKAADAQATIVHTLVQADMRTALIQAAAAQQVPEFDLVGGLMEHLAHNLGEAPLGQPGRYRRLHDSYFKRVEAIEFAVNHDDGKRVAELPQAEIVLLGVSRVGKTPLSMYLSIQGWKVANVPLVTGIPLPEELDQVDPARVVGLIIEPQDLLIHRRMRQQHMGLGEGAYTERRLVVDEVRAASHLFHARGYAVVDVTDKPIETSGAEIIAAVTRGRGRAHESAL